MTTQKHTQGPWEIAHCRGSNLVVADSGFEVATLSQRITTEEGKANAHLIAAAPDMLIALQTIALHATSLDVQGIRELCDSAIAKAQGEA